MAKTTTEEVLSQQTGILWLSLLLPSLLLKCVTDRGGSVVLWCGLKFSIRCAGSWFSLEVLAKVSQHQDPAHGALYELQSDLQMADTCVGLRGTWKRLSYESKTPATRAT